MQCFTCSRTLCWIIMPVARWHPCTCLRYCLVIIHIYSVPNDIPCLQTVKKTIYWNKIRKLRWSVQDLPATSTVHYSKRQQRYIAFSNLFFQEKENIERIFIHLINVLIFDTENVWTLQYLGCVLRYIENTTKALFLYQRKSTFFHVSGNL